MAALWLCTGCVYIRGPQSPATAPLSADTTAATPSCTSAGNASAGGNHVTATPAETAAILAEVQQLGQVDPIAQNALLEDMKKTDPSLWPQLVQTFHASVAFHREAAERDRLAKQQSGSSQITQIAQPTSTEPPVDTPLRSTLLDQSQIAEPSGQVNRFLATSWPQALPDSADGPLSPKSPPAEFVASYPNTHLPEFHVCGAEETVAADWHDQLAMAIKTLESRIISADSANAPPTSADWLTLRMLYLAAGRRDDATRLPANPAAVNQEFWDEEFSGLAATLDEKHLPDASQRAGQAMPHLHNAVTKLGQSAPLVVRNLAFCTEVLSYGIYKPFANYDFKPAQEAVLYAEVENFASQPTDKGYHTSLKSRYQIVDSRGLRVANQEYALTEEWCKNPRCDYFVRYFLYMPSRIASGNYTLELTIEDTLGNKQGQSSIPFTIATD